MVDYKDSENLEISGKPSVGARVFDGLYLFSKILAVFILVLAVCMSCGKASAEEMPSFAKQPLIDWLDTNVPNWTNYQSQYDLAFNSCPYYVTFSANDYLFVDFFVTDGIAFSNTMGYANNGFYYMSGTAYGPSGSGYVVTPDPNVRFSSAGIVGYRFMIEKWGSFNLKFALSFSVSSPLTRGSYNNTYYYNSSTSVIYGSTSGAALSNPSFNFSNSIDYGDNYVNNGYRSFRLVETSIPLYSEDTRLQFATVPDTYGNKFLWINLTQFLDGTGSRISYDIPSLPSIILDINGSSQSFSLPDVYLTNLTSNTSGSGTFVPVLRYQVPFSFFNFDDDDEVTVTNFTFSLTRTNFTDSETTDYRIACSYPMQTTASNAPTGEPIASDPDTITNKITNITYNEIVDKVNFADGYYSPEGGGGNPLVVPDGYTVKYVTITGTRTLASIIQTIYDDFDVTIDTARDVVQYITGISQTDAAERFIEDSVRDNHYTQSYDIVVYYWAPDASLGEVDVMYYYLTEAGRIRGISQIVADIYRDVNQTAYNTYALYDFLYQRLNDFEDKTLASLYEQLGVSKGIQSSVTLANSTLVDILNAINGLDIPAPSVDYTGLLQSILQALGNMSGGSADLSGVEEKLDKLVTFFVADYTVGSSAGYKKYVRWLKSEDQEGRYPGWWFHEGFDSFKSIYSWLDVTADFDPAEEGTQSVFNIINNFFRVTGDGSDPVGVYYHGIYSSGFDPDLYNGGVFTLTDDF